MTTKKFVLLDSNALVHRAFHALPPTLSTPNGVPTNAVYGFTSVLMKILKEMRPDYVAAAFDLAGPTFRHEEFAEYKAHRPKGPDELYEQLPMAKGVARAFGIPVYEQAGYEADDIIGTLAEHAKKHKDLQVIIVTGDLDTLQLVTDSSVIVSALKSGVSDMVIYDENGVKKRYGLSPDQMPDYKGLVGDPSDNIPGVPRVGPVIAEKLLKKYGTLEKLYQALDRGKVAVISPKMAENIKEHRDMAFFSKKLATIVRTVPVEFDLERTGWQSNADRANLEKTLKDLGFFSLVKRLPEVLAGKPAPSAPSPKEGGIIVKIVTDTTDIPLQDEFAIDTGEYLRISPAPNLVYEYRGDNEALAEHLKNCTLLGHGIKPVLKRLIKNGALPQNRIFDTEIAAYLLNPDLREYDFYKIYYAQCGSTADENPAFRPAYFWNLKKVLWERLKSEKLTGVFEDIEMPLISVLARMEQTGIAIDAAAIKKLSASTAKELGRLEKHIYKIAGGAFNLNSPQQLGQVLFERLGLKGKVRKTGGGAPSTAAPELEKLRDEHPVIDQILQWRELQKLKTTYIDPFPALLDKDRRIHTTYNQTGTATGRLASQDPNLQNIPTRTELGQKFRRAFIAGPGLSLVSFDYTQLELRIAAHLARDEKMMQAFKNGEDIHTRTAAEVFDVSTQKVTKEMRRQAKVLNFGIMYGMGALGFARAAGIDRTRARQFIDEYFEEFRGIARYMDKTKDQAESQGFVTTLFGRKRLLPDITSTIPFVRAQAERMAINHPIQGTEADLIKLAMIRIDAYLRKHDLIREVRMLLQVHDELVFEVRTQDVRSIAKIIKEIMESVHALDVPLTVDAKQGDTWADVEPLH